MRVRCAREYLEDQWERSRAGARMPIHACPKSVNPEPRTLPPMCTGEQVAASKGTELRVLGLINLNNSTFKPPFIPPLFPPLTPPFIDLDRRTKAGD